MRDDTCEDCVNRVPNGEDWGCHTGHDLEYLDISVTGCPRHERDEFMCMECGKFMSIKHKGKATLDGDPYNVCIWCCNQEQMKQSYSNL